VNRIGTRISAGNVFRRMYFGSLRFHRSDDACPKRTLAIGDPIITAPRYCSSSAPAASRRSFRSTSAADAMEGHSGLSTDPCCDDGHCRRLYVARSNALFVLAPKSMLVVAIVGSNRDLRASIGLVQNDIKVCLRTRRVSTRIYVSRAGVGAFAAASFTSSRTLFQSSALPRAAP